MDEFADVLEAHRAYRARFSPAPSTVSKGLAIITCMDARLDPAAMLGLEVGDAVVVRNGGARVSDEVLSALIVARHLLQVRRVMVIAHTDCRMTAAAQDEIHDAIDRAGGPDTRSRHFPVTGDPRKAAVEDAERISGDPLLTGLVAGAFIYDVSTGALEHLR
jgi:carbonic anhydrase